MSVLPLAHWTAPAHPQYLNQASLPAFTPEIAPRRDEPPVKRRRIHDDGISSPVAHPAREGTRHAFSKLLPTGPSFKDCLRSYVVPCVRREIAKLPVSWELTPQESSPMQELAVKVVTTIARWKWFKSRFDLTAGVLTQDDQDSISARAAYVVELLSKVDSSVPAPPGMLPTPPTEQPRVREALQTRTLSSLSNALSPVLVRASPSVPPKATLEEQSGPTTRNQPLTGAVKPRRPRKAPISIRPRKRLPILPTAPPILPKLPTEAVRTAASGQKHPAPSGLSTIAAAQRSNTSSWFQLKRRPYLTVADRDSITKGLQIFDGLATRIASTVYHVDFSADEVVQIVASASAYLPGAQGRPATLATLTRLCHEAHIPSLVNIPGRDVEDVRNFCSDLLAGNATPLENSRVLSLSADTDNQQNEEQRASRISSLLFAREIEGNKGFGRTRRLENFENEFKKAQEDRLAVIAEFTNCAGDVAAISWVSDNNFVCGTTAHSDTHNQQYNKPGNLLLCSTTQDTLRGFADHRIPRPLVNKGENSTEAMRQSQDPWLYSSVVSSDYDEIHDRAYTSSFDKTVKVWKVDKAGKAMAALGTWKHEGNVNFVVAAKGGSGRVATASDVPSEAVRIYTVNQDNIADSPFQSFSCSRRDADGSDKWAYFPATMQWGRAPGAQHLLVVGYSPRSLRGDDHDIPEDKRESGEITLWDARQGRRIHMITATTANVFEVAWHPTLERFALATTPCGNNLEHGARTQIHMFQRDRDRDDGGYTEFQSLDCPASDVNELTIMPNALLHAYITAACTDGKVYVWDTARGDKPIHVLEHGYPLDEFSGDREKEDTGVKFTAWGTSPDRFYTGGSDGVVKVWNVRKGRRPLERVLLKAPGPISCGAFSPDQSKLAVGDATGRVFLLSLDKRDEQETHFLSLPSSTRRIRRPRPFIPHPEPPPPEQDSDAMEHDAPEVSISTYARQAYLDSQQLVLANNPVIGAVQGPSYAATGLFRLEAHLDDDSSAPLLSQYDRLQRSSVEASRGSRQRSIGRIKDPMAPSSKLEAAHQKNKLLNTNSELDVSALDEETFDELVQAGAALYLNEAEAWGFDMPDSEI